MRHRRNEFITQRITQRITPLLGLRYAIRNAALAIAVRGCMCFERCCLACNYCPLWLQLKGTLKLAKCSAARNSIRTGAYEHTSVRTSPCNLDLAFEWLYLTR